MFFFESRKTKFFFLPFVCHLPFAKKRERKKDKKREATKIKNLGRKKPPLKIRDDDDDDDDDFEKSGKDSELEEEEEEEEARF